MAMVLDVLCSGMRYDQHIYWRRCGSVLFATAADHSSKLLLHFDGPGRIGNGVGGRTALVSNRDMRKCV